MRGKLIKVRAKKTTKYLSDIFKVGDELHIQSILYDEDTKLVNELAIVYHKDNPKKYMLSGIIPQLANKPVGTKIEQESGMIIQKAFDVVIAPKGSYKRSILVLNNGSEYPSELLGNFGFDEFFEKI